MKKIALSLILGCILTVSASVRTSSADNPVDLPVCATNGDKDGDGVSDAVDSSEADSCIATSTGYENCATGAGDGIDDCQ